jgi:CheY-like chemotaxis protein
VLDGLAATRVLRESPGLRSLPVIALTANTRDDDRQACQAAGMDDFLAKPVDLRVLADTLVRWLPER